MNLLREAFSFIDSATYLQQVQINNWVNDTQLDPVPKPEDLPLRAERLPALLSKFPLPEDFDFGLLTIDLDELRDGIGKPIRRGTEGLIVSPIEGFNNHNTRNGFFNRVEPLDPTYEGATVDMAYDGVGMGPFIDNGPIFWGLLDPYRFDYEKDEWIPNDGNLHLLSVMGIAIDYRTDTALITQIQGAVKNAEYRDGTTFDGIKKKFSFDWRAAMVQSAQHIVTTLNDTNPDYKIEHLAILPNDRSRWLPVRVRIGNVMDYDDLALRLGFEPEPELGGVFVIDL